MNGVKGLKFMFSKLQHFECDCRFQKTLATLTHLQNNELDDSEEILSSTADSQVVYDGSGETTTTITMVPVSSNPVICNYIVIFIDF